MAGGSIGLCDTRHKPCDAEVVAPAYFVRDGGARSLYPCLYTWSA